MKNIASPTIARRATKPIPVPRPAFAPVESPEFVETEAVDVEVVGDGVEKLPGGVFERLADVEEVEEMKSAAL